MANIEHKKTKAEQKRLDDFNLIRTELQEKGYKSKELIIGIISANIVAFCILLVSAFVSVGIYIFIYGLPSLDKEFAAMLRITFIEYIIFLLVFLLIVTVVHELLHGITWAIFAENGFKDISFGIVREYLTPYCTCKTPLKKKQYIVGALMPLLIIGIIPVVLGMFFSSILLVIIGVFNIYGAGGDIMIACKIISYKTSSKEILMYDHPADCGCVVFER